MYSPEFHPEPADWEDYLRWRSSETPGDPLDSSGLDWPEDSDDTEPPTDTEIPF